MQHATGDGNVRLSIPVDGLTKVVTLNLKQLEADQSRYGAAVSAAKRFVFIDGREQRRFEFPSLPKTLALELKPGREEELADFVGIPELNPEGEEKLIKNSLMVTHLSVVEDPERTTEHGPWTFKHLMTQMAHRGATGIDPVEFVRRWLKHWEVEQKVDEKTGAFTSPARPNIKTKIIDPWEIASGGLGKPLDLTKAPFRLLAIINRLDLRSNRVLGVERIGGGGAGEARFVFCAVDLNDKDASGNPKPLPFTVIFEYQVKRKNFHDVREWAQQWYALKDLHLGSSRYNKALQRITDQFVEAGADAESPLNQSALSQLRTNEIALAGPWELREFRIDATHSGYLRQVTVKQTPDASVDDQPILAQFVNARQADLLAKEHQVPAEFPAGKPFLAIAAPTPPDFFWKEASIHKTEARHLFSLATCNACHAREAFPPFIGGDDLTKDQPPPHFTHVRPRQAGKEARLSPFLTGKDAMGNAFLLEDPTGQANPVDPTKKLEREFHDLSNRAHDLDALIQFGAIYESRRKPLQMVH